MSILHVNQIKAHLEQEFREKIDMSGLEGGKEYAENCFLSRSLAAYAIQHHAECSVQVAANSVVDASKDNGIDAVLYDSRSKTLFIVQSKWMHDGKGEPDNGSVKKFISGIKDLLNFRFERFNNKIARSARSIRDAVCDPATRYQLILTYTGINDLAEPSRRDINDVLAEFNDASEMVFFSNFNQKKIHSSLVYLASSGTPIHIQISLKSWGKVSEPYTAYYGQVNGQEIYSWWNQHRNKLFEKNIRGVLSDSQVNEEIATTLSTNPEQFWFFNNGITIICDDANKNMVGGATTDFGQFTYTNISIVNGAQTVSTIGRFGEQDLERLSKVFVPVRIVTLKGTEDSFGQKITKANNTQNRVESRDFVTFDPEQSRIREELILDNIDYRIIRGNAETAEDSSFDLVESTTALACASRDIGVVVQLKREIGKLWENLNSSPYRQLFNPSVTGRYVYNCVVTQRLIDASIKGMEIRLGSGREQSILIHGNRIVSLLVFDEVSTAQFREGLIGKDTDELGSRIVSLVDENYQLLKAEIDANFENAMIPTLFKNKRKCELLYQNIKRKKERS